MTAREILKQRLEIEGCRTIIEASERTLRTLLLTVMKIHVEAPNGSELERDALTMQSVIYMHFALWATVPAQTDAVDVPPIAYDAIAPAKVIH